MSFTAPSFARNIIDAVGAGDALLAYSSLCMASTKSLVASTIIGLVAAACECEYEGNKAVEIKSIIEKIDLIEKSTNFKTSK
mgnify:FL=1